MSVLHEFLCGVLSTHLSSPQSCTGVTTSATCCVLTVGSEFTDSAFSNVAATFRQCPSPIVSKLSTHGIKTEI